jgi:hypothetical protein
MAKSEVTSRRAASVASKVLRDGGSSKSAKSAAGSALSQRSTTNTTSSRAATAASKALNSSGSSKSARTAAGSALTQKPKR